MFEQLTALMPEGWEAQAKALGALQRAREIKTPEDLLRLILLYLTEGKSFGGTSAILRMEGEWHLGKKAIWSRIGNSAEWLRWLCEHLCRRQGILVEKPAWLLGDARLIAKKMWKWEEEYFRFIEEKLEPTNNPAELTIRQTVLDRIVTQGSRSIRGTEWHERFWTVLTTCGLQNVSVLDNRERFFLP